MLSGEPPQDSGIRSANTGGMTGANGSPESVPELVAALTTAEKLSLVRGDYPGRGERGVPVAGYLPPVERLGIGPLRLADGPLGVRSGEATAFPATLALGATFDPSLASTFGRAVGAEARAKGIDVLLAPGCNLVRVPQCGRAFEYYGEDPHHSGQFAAATVRGIQSQGVVATPKHYVANTQEHSRVTASAELSERALRELYLRAFETAVTEADAGAVMAAYNRVNGTHATSHERLLTDLLRGEFGFEGPVVSDWWAVNDGLAAAQAGLDLEMPGVGVAHLAAMSGGPNLLHELRARWPDRLYPERLLGRLIAYAGRPGGIPEPSGSLFARSLPAALGSDTVRSRLDEMVRRVLSLHRRVGALPGESRREADPDRATHRDLARRLAVRGTVLLRNEGVLPLDPGASVALLGPAIESATTGGGGSSAVTPSRAVSPATGVRERAVGPVTVEPGHPPVGENSLTGALFDRRSPGEPTVNVAAVQNAAASVDTAVVVVNDDAGEFSDRETLALPGAQDRLVRAVAETAAQTVVVLQTAGAVEMPWLDAVDAVLELWYPGQEGGRALASVLYGDVAPGGRLPVTFADPADYPTTDPGRYPGVEGDHGYPEVHHTEGLFVGYRYLDEQGLDPLFPFGHGLGYTTVAYESATAALDGDRSVQVTVENTGERAGREVLQVYVQPPQNNVVRPPRELAGFRSVELAAGERRTVAVPLDDRTFTRYNEGVGDWVLDPGRYTLAVGRSARATPLEVTVDAASVRR
ncbi:MAG: beta-glucosidase-related glycosidase [halophilic archaeon J07HX64]|nr:MAG: beta-glucosidase-related glycosidase [halophilic archaeon J07HX64]